MNFRAHNTRVLNVIRLVSLEKYKTLQIISVVMINLFSPRKDTELVIHVW